jgi:hypothetical protein
MLEMIGYETDKILVVLVREVDTSGFRGVGPSLFLGLE